MAVSFDRRLALDYLNQVLWSPTCGAYREAIGGTPRCQACSITPLPEPPGDGRWPCWCNDNYLARIIALKYMPERVSALSTFLGTYRDQRWCLFTPSWADFDPPLRTKPDWERYADYLALDAIYRSMLKQSATSTINKLIEMFDGVWFTDAATGGFLPDGSYVGEGHTTYKCALGGIAFSLHGQGGRAQQCLSTVASQQVQSLSHPEYGGVLTEDLYFVLPGRYQTFANVETTCLAILAHDLIKTGMNILPLALVGAMSVGALIYYRQRKDMWQQ